MARTKVKLLATRKARFKAALASAGLKMSEWAKSQKVSRSHLNQVLSEERKSIRLTDAIDSFTVSVNDQLQRRAK